MNFFQALSSEWRLNKGLKIKIFVALFRISNLCKTSNSGLVRLCLLPIVVIYRFHAAVFVSADLRAETKIGYGLKIFHGTGIVIHPKAIIGENCIIRQGVTIGNKVLGRSDQVSGAPLIGNNVEFGANCVVVGDISVGDCCRIGALTFLDKSLPPHSIATSCQLKIREYHAS